MEWHITRQHTLLGLILNYTGLSIITEVASSLNRVTDCINKRPLVPFFLGCGGRGGGSGGVFPQSILEFQSPKMPFPVFQGLNWEQKSVFFIQENIALIQVSLPHNQFLQAMNKCQYSKLRTFAHKQILGKPTEKCVKNWLKFSICVTRSTSGVTKA